MKQFFKHLKLISIVIITILCSNTIFAENIIDPKKSQKKHRLFIRFANFYDASIQTKNGQEFKWDMVLLGAGYEKTPEAMFGVKFYSDIIFPHQNEHYAGVGLRFGSLFTFHPVSNFALDPYLQAGFGLSFGLIPLLDSATADTKSYNFIFGAYPIFGFGLNFITSFPVSFGFEYSWVPNLMTVKRSIGSLLVPAQDQLMFYLSVVF